VSDRLLIVHVDGLAHPTLMRAIDDGDLPFVKRLLEREGYVAQPYRCGVPSTTPYVQAGILYGDNTDVAGFRWFDKRSGVPVSFGVKSTFKKVAHRYFAGASGLVEGGAAIAACYQAGARRTFGLSYRERRSGADGDHPGRLIGRFLLDPRNLLDVLWHLVYATGVTGWHYVAGRLRGRHPAVPYVLADILEEVFVHHLTRYAVRQAMRDGEPAIYAGFYAYDETAHAFGADDSYSLHMLRHVDHTIRMLFETARSERYEMVVLSDHGQTPTVPFKAVEGRSLGAVLSELLPRYRVEELKGHSFGPRGDALDGHLALAYSGGLAHVYFRDHSGRLSAREIEELCPGLATRLAGLEAVHFVLLREGECNLVVTTSGSRALEDSAAVLEAFDDPRVLAEQLAKLNRFQTAGDLILVGRWDGRRQVNFEDQIGGHGSIGGVQGHPFLMSRAELGLAVESVTDATEIHALLGSLRGTTRTVAPPA
jgi:hypothetical protein